MKTLSIGDGFTLPLDAVTQTFAILAKRGTGKTYTASVMAEEMLKAGQQVVALDPTGAWWGLRSGFPVVIFGGEHADVPLEESAGEVVARALVERRFPAVLDLSLFRKGQARRLVTEFLEALYRLNREPVHLFADEADDLAPQKPFGDEARMVGAMEDVVKRGRKRGIGCTLITQRPADLAKQVLTQCEVLVTLRIVHPRDLAAVREWVNVHGDPETAKGMIAGLPSLPVGEAWFWSPGWGDFFRRVRVRPRETFDSGATPKPGEKAKAPARLAPVDLDALGEQIKATVERARENDPAALKRKLAELERQLRERPAAEPAPDRFEEGKAAGVAEATRALMVKFRGVWSDAAVVAEKAGLVSERMRGLVGACERTPGAVFPLPAPPPAGREPRAEPAGVTPKTIPARPPAAPADGLTGPQQAILDTVATLGVRGIPATRDCVARWLSIHPNGGSYGANLGRLRADGYLDGFALTELGRPAARPRPTGPAAALAALPDEPKRAVLRAVMGFAGPTTRDELAHALGLHPNGGSYGANLGWLRTMGLLTARGPIAATEGLYR